MSELSPLSTVLVNTLPFALLGAVFGLDMVSFPQMMIARPLVSATVAAAFAGQPEAGLLIGAVLELIALETLPFGASRYPEWGSAGAVGGVVMALHPLHTPAHLPLAVLAALATAYVSSWSMIVLRKFNVRTVRAYRAEVEGGAYSAVRAVQLRGLGADFLRGGLVTYIALLIFVPLSYTIAPLWKTNAVYSRAIVIAVAAMVAAGAVWKLFHTTKHAAWFFLTGLAIGGAALVTR
jgi:mannose/fructose/N-acetylgalactosamine-specific phosphotransferase system component IIC